MISHTCMARRKPETGPPDLAALLAPVAGVPVRSMPFTPAWRKLARERCAELGVHQRDLATWCGCVQGSISNVLGKREPSFWRTDYLERISTALRLPLPARARLEIAGAEIGDDEARLSRFLDAIDLFKGAAK